MQEDRDERFCWWLEGGERVRKRGLGPLRSRLEDKSFGVQARYITVMGMRRSSVTLRTSSELAGAEEARTLDRLIW